MSFKIETTRDISPTLLGLSSAYSGEGNRISWPSSKLDEFSFALIASLKFTPKVEDHLKDAAIWKTINACARAKKFSRSFFLDSLRSALNEIDSNKSKSFSVVTQLNVPSNRPFPKSLRSVYGKIELRTRIQKWETRAANEWRSEWREQAQLQPNFVYLRHRFLAKNARSAIDHGYRNIQCCIGILNLVARGYGLSKRIGLPNVPLGKLLSACAYLLSDEGERSFGSWLTESNYPHRFSFFTATSVELNELPKFVNRWVRRIKTTNFPEKIASAIILFQEGLSATQIDRALLKFWTCIELLCAREGQRESVEKIIERASSIFNQHEISRLRLQFIAESRHSMVHRGESGDHALLCAQWASIYAAELIEFFVHNKWRLRKHEQIIDYLNTPISEDRLNEVLSVHRLRLRTVKSGKRRSK